jgi:hypothetical protein
MRLFAAPLEVAIAECRGAESHDDDETRRAGIAENEGLGHASSAVEE